jgi:hypothetical protein
MTVTAQPKLSIYACHLLGKMVKESPSYPTAVALDCSQEQEEAAEKEGLPGNFALVNEIANSFITITNEPRLQRFRFIHHYDLDEGSVTLSVDFMSWPGRADYVKIFESATTPEEIKDLASLTAGLQQVLG